MAALKLSHDVGFHSATPSLEPAEPQLQGDLASLASCQEQLGQECPEAPTVQAGTGSCMVATSTLMGALVSFLSPDCLSLAQRGCLSRELASRSHSKCSADLVAEMQGWLYFLL